MCNAPLVTLLAVDDDALKRVDNSLGKRALTGNKLHEERKQILRDTTRANVVLCIQAG